MFALSPKDIELDLCTLAGAVAAGGSSSRSESAPSSLPVRYSLYFRFSKVSRATALRDD